MCPISDLDNLSNADPTVLTGPDKAYGAKVSSQNELGTADVLDNGGVDKILALATTPKLGVTNIDGVTPKPNRKYFIMEGLDTNIKWGFSNTTQSFDLFKSQVLMIPVGPNTQIWFKVTSGTGNVAIGEIS